MSFAKILRVNNRTLSWLTIAALIVATMLPALLNNSRVDAAQVTNRRITLGSSAASAETTYQIQFTVPDNGTENVGSFRVEFCNSDPLPNQTCTNTAIGDDVPQVDNGAGSIATLSGSPTFNSQAISMTAPAAGDRYLDFTLAAQTDIASATQFNVTVNDVNNPSNSTSGTNNDSFYARVYVYSAVSPPAAANPMPTTNQTNEGGIALSTAEQITVEARVQERLTFTVGTDTVAGDCATISGTTVDLGILDAADAVFNRATVNSANSASPNVDGICTEVTTNASNGATISYLATDLQVSGATCTTGNGDIDGTPLSTDECINWDNDSPAAYSAGVERWGIGILSTPTNGTNSTNNMQIAAGASDYDETTWSNTVPVDPYATTAIELGNTNSSVASGESLLIDVAAEAAITTPTGLYQATLTFIATSDF